MVAVTFIGEVFDLQVADAIGPARLQKGLRTIQNIRHHWPFDPFPYRVGVFSQSLPRRLLLLRRPAAALQCHCVLDDDREGGGSENERLKYSWLVVRAPSHQHNPLRFDDHLGQEFRRVPPSPSRLVLFLFLHWCRPGPPIPLPDEQIVRFKISFSRQSHGDHQ